MIPTHITGTRAKATRIKRSFNLIPSMPAIFFILSLKHEFIQQCNLLLYPSSTSTDTAPLFQSETRPFIRQRLEIGMDRSGGINSFFTLRPRHPYHSFQYHPGSAIREAGRNAGGLISRYMVGICVAKPHPCPPSTSQQACAVERTPSDLSSRTPIRSYVIPPKS